MREQPLDLKPLNHYLDPPPLWFTAKKKAFYSDGFAEKSIRPLMQFSLDPSFTPAVFKSWEEDYKDIYAWLHTIESPKYHGCHQQESGHTRPGSLFQTCARAMAFRDAAANIRIRWCLLRWSTPIAPASTV